MFVLMSSIHYLKAHQRVTCRIQGPISVSAPFCINIDGSDARVKFWDPKPVVMATIHEGDLLTAAGYRAKVVIGTTSLRLSLPGSPTSTYACRNSSLSLEQSDYCSLCCYSSRDDAVQREIDDLGVGRWRWLPF